MICQRENAYHLIFYVRYHQEKKNTDLTQGVTYKNLLFKFSASIERKCYQETI